MKFKHLIIISLLLTILTVSAVSASDDVLTVSSEIDNSTKEMPDVNQGFEETNLAQNDEESVIGVSDEISYDIYDEVTMGDIDDEQVINFVSYDKSETGLLEVHVDNDLKYSDKITSSDYYYDSDIEDYVYQVGLYLDDLDMTEYGTYFVKLTFQNEILSQTYVTVSYPLEVYVSGHDYHDEEFPVGETLMFNMYLPDDTINQLTLTVNGKSYNINYKDGEGKFSLSTNDWRIGEYTAVLTYYGDSKYPKRYAQTTFSVIPKFTYPNVISKGEREFLTITAPSGSNGNAAIYKYKNYDKDILIGNALITNGYGRFSLSNLDSGDNDFLVEYNVGSFKSTYYFSITIKNNSPLFSSSISASEINQGNPLTVNVRGPKVNSFVSIYVDDKESKSLSLVNGEISDVISGLSLGSHKINVFFDVNNQFYSNTFYVTVKNAPALPKVVVDDSKPRLIFKAVKIKKSAKKLVLSATLKTTAGKALKSIKIKFKFNGKKFSAKTNKKGIAKLVISKKVLKKLKVGKKVKYQASYGKLTVKKSSKVRK